MLMDMLEKTDPDLYKLLLAEQQRQRDGLELIASENYVSRAVLEALGTEFTNKYSEGYPGRRYYGGQENTDQIEQIAIDRAKALFGADHANVQALTGAPANIAVFFAWCEPGDTILGMDLTHGGHLTQGHPVTHMGKLFNFVRYRMKDIETGEIDFDELRDIAKKTRPKIVMAGFSGYPREVNWAKFAEIGHEVGALLMADIAHTAGLIAGKAAANPFDAGFHVLTSTTHKTLRGPRGGLILSRGTVSNPLRAPELTIDNIPTLIDRSVFPGLQGGPVMNSVFAKAVAFGEAQRPEFADYAQQIIKNAHALATKLMSKGFKLITNGTDNHLMLIDMVTSFGIDGAEAETALDAIGLTANKNVIPDDTNPPFRPSGLRLGTPALTTRGLDEGHMSQLADWILQAVLKRADQKALKSLRQEVQRFSRQFPLPSD